MNGVEARSTSSQPLFRAPSVRSTDSGYHERFDRDFFEPEYAQYRSASTWKVAYKAAQQLGKLDTSKPKDVLDASRLASVREALPSWCLEGPTADPRHLSGDVASEFVFKKCGLDLSAAQAERLMALNSDELIRGLTYYTLPWYARAVAFALGKAPQYSAAAYLVEYMRQGEDRAFALFQDLRRRL
jgi:hypothetical protein